MSGFCSADSWHNEDQKLAVQKPKLCLTWNFLSALGFTQNSGGVIEIHKWLFHLLFLIQLRLFCVSSTSVGKSSSPSEMNLLRHLGSSRSSICSSLVRCLRTVARHRSCDASERLLSWSWSEFTILYKYQLQSDKSGRGRGRDGDMGWVDCDFGPSTVCQVLARQMGVIGQDGGISQIEVNPTHVPNHFWHPVSLHW